MSWRPDLRNVKAGHHPVKLLNARIATAVKFNSWPTAALLLQERAQQRPAPSLLVYKRVLQLLFAFATWQHAVAVLAVLQLADVAVPATLLAAAARVCGKAGAWRAGLACLRSARRRFALTHVLDNAEIWSYGRGDQWQGALVALGAAVARGAELDLVMRNVAMSACARVKKWRVVMGLLAGLQAVGLHANIVVLTVVLNACKDDGVWRQALQTFYSTDVECCEKTYRDAADGCINGDAWQPALLVLRDAALQGLQADAWRTARAIARGGQWRALLEVREPEQGRLQLGAGGQWRAAALLAAVARQGLRPAPLQPTCDSPAEAWEWCQRQLLHLQGSGVPLREGIGATAAAHGSQWASALLQVANAKDDVGMNNVVLKACGQAVAWRKVIHCLTDGLRLDAVTAMLCCKALESAGRWQGTLGLLQGLNVAALRLNAQCSIAEITAHGSADNWRQSLVCLDGALLMSPVAQSAAATACSRGKRWSSAVALLAASGSRQCEPNVVCANTVLNACQVAQAWPSALRLFSQLRSEMEMDSLGTGTAMNACARSTRWELALLTLRGIEPDALTCSSALLACKEASNVELAVQLLQEAQAAGIRTGVVALSTALATCARATWWYSALLLLKELSMQGIESDKVAWGASCFGCNIASQWQQNLEAVEAARQRGLLEAGPERYGHVLRRRAKVLGWSELLELVTPEGAPQLAADANALLRR